MNAERFTGPAIFHPIKLDTILGFRCPFDAVKAVPALCFQVPEFTVLGYQRRGASKSDYGEGQAETGRFGLRQVEYLANRALNRPIVRLLFGKSPAAVGKDLQPK